MPAVTKSRRKLDDYALSKQRDQKARAISEEEGIEFWKAYERVLDEEDE